MHPQQRIRMVKTYRICFQCCSKWIFGKKMEMNKIFCLPSWLWSITFWFSKFFFFGLADAFAIKILRHTTSKVFFSIFTVLITPKNCDILHFFNFFNSFYRDECNADRRTHLIHNGNRRWPINFKTFSWMKESNAK